MKHFLITLLLSTIATLTVQGQGKDFVETDGITNPLHQANVGRITFMQGNIPLENYKATDFLTSFRLTPASDLNIRVFLGNSITNYMHPLAPEMTADELNKSGNYQFSFYIDNQLVYKENLHHGAGLRKSTTTTFRVPLTSTKGEDWWSLYLWNRMMMRGGEKALTEGKHLLKIELRPYIITKEVKVGDIIAEGQIELIIKLPVATPEQIAIQAIGPDSGWPISKAAFNKSKIEELNKSIAQNQFKAITSLVVIKDGKLLIEEYFNNANRNTMHDTRSVGKSFTSTMMGIAIKEGYIKSENQPLQSFYDLKQFSNYSAKKDSVRIVDLLKMSSAFDGSDAIGESPGNEENMYPSANWVKFALDLSMDKNKTNGKQWDYFTAGVVLLGDIIHKSVPEGLEKYADKKLFKPLGIKEYQWQYTPQNVANTAGGLQMSSLNYARFGQLYKNKGLWNGQQILPQSWVEKTFTRQIAVPNRNNEFYGYLFWNKTYVVEGKSYETFYCAGNGGSKIFMFKDLPLTIVVTAKAYNMPYGHAQVDRMMEEYILPAILGK